MLLVGRYSHARIPLRIASPAPSSISSPFRTVPDQAHQWAEFRAISGRKCLPNLFPRDAAGNSIACQPLSCLHSRGDYSINTPCGVIDAVSTGGYLCHRDSIGPSAGVLRVCPDLSSVSPNRPHRDIATYQPQQTVNGTPRVQRFHPGAEPVHPNACYRGAGAGGTDGAGAGSRLAST